MSAAAKLKAYKGAAVSKHFPGWGWYAGTVTRVDGKGTDDKPFFIEYDDGDAEWMTQEELQQVLVDHAQQQPVTKTVAKRAKPARRCDQKRGGAGAGDASGDDDEAGGNDVAGKAEKAASAGRKRPAADASRSGGGKQHKGRGGKPTARAQQSVGELAAEAGAEPAPDADATAAAAAAAAAAVEDGAVAAGAAAASDTPSQAFDDVAGLIDDIAQAAGDTARRLNEERSVMRLAPSSAPPAGGGLPAMSQGCVAGGMCLFSLYGQPRSQPTVDGTAAGTPDYAAEASELLAELDRLLAAAGSSRNLVVKVVVHLRSMMDGLRAFTDAWNAWVHRDSLPVLTLLEGAGPLSGAGVVLEASALPSTEAD